jgi:hypothetical protein
MMQALATVKNGPICKFPRNATEEEREMQGEIWRKCVVKGWETLVFDQDVTLSSVLQLIVFVLPLYDAWPLSKK